MSLTPENLVRDPTGHLVHNGTHLVYHESFRLYYDIEGVTWPPAGTWLLRWNGTPFVGTYEWHTLIFGIHWFMLYWDSGLWHLQERTGAWLGSVLIGEYTRSDPAPPWINGPVALKANWTLVSGTVDFTGVSNPHN